MRTQPERGLILHGPHCGAKGVPRLLRLGHAPNLEISRAAPYCFAPSHSDKLTHMNKAVFSLLLVAFLVLNVAKVAAEVEWLFYFLPANLEIAVPENWEPTTGAAFSFERVLWLTIYNERGLSMANLQVTKILDADENSRRIATQAFLSHVHEDPVLLEKMIRAQDTARRTEIEVQMAYLGIPINWLGTEIKEVGTLWSFVTKYEWTLTKKIGPLESKEVFKVVEVKTWNDGDTCDIRMEYSKDFPEMAAITQVMLTTLRIKDGK